MLFPRSTAEGTLDTARRERFSSAPEIGQQDEAGRYWAGYDYSYQSPESFNKLYGTRLPTVGNTDSFSDTPAPPEVGADTRPPARPPAPATRPGAQQQAGQPSLPSPPGGMLGQVVLSNGAGVPAQRQNVQERALSQEVLNAAQQYANRTDVPLPAFYEGQQQLGRSMAQTGQLQRRLTDLGAAPGMEQKMLEAWVKANPGLAYRELMRLQGGR